MKTLKIFVLTVMLLGLTSISLFALDRVVCEVEVLSDHSANIHLKWQGDIQQEGIRITGWKLVNEDTLKITYQTGSNVEAGWDSRKIEDAKFNFPMKIILEENGNATSVFTDLPATDQEKYSILNLYSRDIIAGYNDGRFKPNSNVTRAEFAKMITKTANYTLDQNSISSFKDVKADYWGLSYIMTLAQKEILKGRSNGNFDPGGSINIGEVLAVINRTFTLYSKDKPYNYDLLKHWSNDDFTALVEAGIVQPSDIFYYPYKPDVKATRVQCAVLLSRILEELHETK